MTAAARRRAIRLRNNAGPICIALGAACLLVAILASGGRF